MQPATKDIHLEELLKLLWLRVVLVYLMMVSESWEAKRGLMKGRGLPLTNQDENCSLEYKGSK